MTNAKIKEKMKKYEQRRDEHLAEGRPVSAASEDAVVQALRRQLETRIGGSPKN